MIFVLQKGQVMILDLLLLLIICILILSIEEKAITNYKLDINNREKEINYLKESMIVEQLISDCNFLATEGTSTKVCYKNKIELKNIGYLPTNVCKIGIDEFYYYLKNDSRNVYKRGVIYNNSFSVLEVGFCE